MLFDQITELRNNQNDAKILICPQTTKCTSEYMWSG